MNYGTAVAWYRRDQWPRLLELAADSADLESTYDEWLRMATATLLRIDPMGDRVTQVDIDVEDLWRWCQSEGRALDAESRAMYAADRARAEGESHRPD